MAHGEGRRDCVLPLYKFKKDPPQVLFCDTACHCEESGMNWLPHYYQNVKMFHDIFHGYQHLCSGTFDSRRSPKYNRIQTSLVEQCNSYLQSLRGVAKSGTMKLSTFMFWIEVFVVEWNYRKMNWVVLLLWILSRTQPKVRDVFLQEPHGRWEQPHGRWEQPHGCWEQPCGRWLLPASFWWRDWPQWSSIGRWLMQAATFTHQWIPEFLSWISFIDSPNDVFILVYSMQEAEHAQFWQLSLIFQADFVFINRWSLMTISA